VDPHSGPIEIDRRPTVSDAADFGRWVAPHWSSMAKLSARYSNDVDYEDIVQEALAVAWRKRRSFDPERGSPRNRLLAITADQGRKASRKRSRQLSAPLRDDAPIQPSIDAKIDLDRALQTFTARQKLAVDLYYYLGLPIADVAAVVGCAEGTTKSTLSDARAQLRTHLGGDFT
jgi:RNA polymerase sigma-70 factor (ECF subfamily)